VDRNGNELERWLANSTVQIFGASGEVIKTLVGLSNGMLRDPSATPCTLY
jgi:hypothetical protein